MNEQEYSNGFDEILQMDIKQVPYNDTSYLEYTKLNKSRFNRWIKTGMLLQQNILQLKNINKQQNWVLITEHWCGDAAHIVPFIIKLAAINPLINLEIQLRDSNSEIENYLTNGGKSIPILIIRDENKKDIVVWGPRPKECQFLYLEMKKDNIELNEQKIQLQNWYNHDNGVSIQNEICALLPLT